MATVAFILGVTEDMTAVDKQCCTVSVPLISSGISAGRKHLVECRELMHPRVVVVVEQGLTSHQTHYRSYRGSGVARVVRSAPGGTLPGAANGRKFCTILKHPIDPNLTFYENNTPPATCDMVNLSSIGL